MKAFDYDDKIEKDLNGNDVKITDKQF